ncbi:MAG: FHA domain-containing protein [Planctomycetota bacterium]|jgi:pSer/pThr/pTyr-binding forkhead associated (FHA) protein
MRSARDYDKTAKLTLAGTDGLLRDDVYPLYLGQSVLVGRSRKCQVSTRRSRTFLASSEVEQREILAMESFLKVSRRHVRLTYLARNQVEIWDLSKNGTYVDGKRVDRMLVPVLGEHPVEIRLAKSERLLLSQGLPADVESTATATV